MSMWWSRRSPKIHPNCFWTSNRCNFTYAQGLCCSGRGLGTLWRKKSLFELWVGVPFQEIPNMFSTCSQKKQMSQLRNVEWMWICPRSLRWNHLTLSKKWGSLTYAEAESFCSLQGRSEKKKKKKKTNIGWTWDNRIVCDLFLGNACKKQTLSSGEKSERWYTFTYMT